MRCDCRRRAQIIKVYINTLTLICLILFGLCSHYFKQIRRSAVLNCRIKTEFLSGVQRGMCRPHVILLTKKGPAGSVISFGIQNMTKWKETKHTFKKNLFSGPKHLEFAERKHQCCRAPSIGYQSQRERWSCSCVFAEMKLGAWSRDAVPVLWELSPFSHLPPLFSRGAWCPG